MLEYRGASTVETASKLLSEKEFEFITMLNADVNKVEQLLTKAGFEVVRRCKEAEAELRIEKISEGRLYVGC